MLGTHPGTGRAYEWRNVDSCGVAADSLTTITREQADAFLDYLADAFDTLGTSTEREGTGRPVTHAAAAGQQALVAPTLEEAPDAPNVHRRGK